MKKNLNKGYHLTYEERIRIERGLDEGLSFKELAVALGKHPSTISREVKKHRIEIAPKSFCNPYATNKCIYRYTCFFTNVCYPHTCGNKKCKTCGKCNAVCKKFVFDECKKAIRAPYVCNGCPKADKQCQFGRRLYKANIAQREYVELLHEAREGINLTKEQLAALDELFTPLVLKGQPISHIYATHRAEMPCSIRTIYTYVEKQYFTFKNIDLRRKVRYKVRNKRRVSQSTLLAIKLERRYRDFIRYIEEYDPDVVELDTVIGAQSSRTCLLTILFRKYRLMWAFKLERNTQACVLEAMNHIEATIGTDVFKELFPVILTDNGSEFLRPLELERSISGGRRTLIFYCDPNSAFQKGAIEKNHEFIRYVIPKGFAFDDYTQEDFNLLMSNINSTKRPALNGKSPFEAAPEILKKASRKLQLIPVPPDEVNLTTSLLLK